MMDGEAASAPESFIIFNRSTDSEHFPKPAPRTFFHKQQSKTRLHTFLQEPVVGGVSGSSLERRLPVGTPGVVGLRFARNGDEKRT